MTETLSLYASIAEIIGAVAVVVTLIFVGVQLRANTKATRSATSSAASTATGEWYWNIGSNAEASSTLWRFLNHPEELTDPERFQGIFILHGTVLAMQNSFLLAREGTLDFGVTKTITTALLSVKDLPGWGYYWDNRKEFFYPQFQEYVEGLVATKDTQVKGIYSAVQSTGVSEEAD